MIIELRNCSLEIGHIGTQEKIAMDELYESVMLVGKALVEAFQNMMEEIRLTMEAYIKAVDLMSKPIPPTFYGLHRI